MNQLTPEQVKTVKALIRLGDSIELAIMTVLDEKPKDCNFYKNAHEL